MPNIAEIRLQYPNPKKSRDDRGMQCDYCVGGAFVMYTTEMEDRFPDVDQLAWVLMENNTDMPEDTAYGYAKRIIDANDEGHFEAAWNILEQALEY